MRKRTWWISGCTGLFALVGMALAIAQSTAGNDPSSARFEKEVSIMKSILETAVSMAVQEGTEEPGPVASTVAKGWVRPRFVDWMHGEVDSYYLPGQGVVFEVDLPDWGGHGFDSLDHVQALLQEVESGRVESEFASAQLAAAKAQVDMARQYVGEGANPYVVAKPRPRGRNARASTGTVGGVAGGVTTDEGAPGSGEEKLSQEQMKAKISELKENLEEARERAAESAEESRARRDRVLKETLEAVAVHGDSLTQLPADEYINLIIGGGGRFPGMRIRGSDDSGAGRTIIAVRKSDILAYKSGSLSLEALRAKVLQ